MPEEQKNLFTSLYIGETSNGLEMPVFFDPHTGIVNSKPPGTLITGQPGSGKTFLAQTLTAMSAILGKTTIVLDPKGDFLSLKNIEHDIGKFTLWDLSRGKSGLLDPFYMAKSSEDKLSLTIEVIELFLGRKMSGAQMTALSPIIKDVIVSETPSLKRVVDELRGSTKDVARDLGTELDMISHLPYAKLCFSPGNNKRSTVNFDKGLTVVTLLGLELPGERGPQTKKENLAAGIIFLLTDFMRRVMMNDQSKNPKTIIIDEAHAVLSSEVGARTVRSIALLGRSKYLALILITQNNSHLDALDVENTISTRFAFGSDRKEAKNIIRAMELPQDEGFDGIIVDLERGECLMKDYQKRYSTVKISSWKKDWLEAFNNNPLEVARKKKEKEEALSRGVALAPQD